MSRALARYLQHGFEVFERHSKQFNERFTSKGRRPRAKDWRPYRFAVRDVIWALTVVRHNARGNFLEVDVCLSADATPFPPHSSAKVALTFLITEAFHTGGSLEVRFTKNVEDGRVPVEIVAYARKLGIDLKHISEGAILPSESRQLYLALTGFSEPVLARIKELAVEGKISTERICYMAHHGVWTREEMEAILLGSPWPERILLGLSDPRERLLHRSDVVFGSIALLGSFLDRGFSLREKTLADGTIVETEGYDRQYKVEFEPRFLAKVYTATEEELPIPWIKGKKVVPVGHRLVALVRPRTSNEFRRRLLDDLEAVSEVKEAYKGDKIPTKFALLVSRDFEDILGGERKALLREIKKSGLLLLVAPEGATRLGRDAENRLETAKTLRRVFLERPEEEEIAESFPVLLLSYPKDKPPVWANVDIAKLMRMARHHEKLLDRGVSPKNDGARYRLICDRIDFIATPTADSVEPSECALSDEYPGIIKKMLAEEPELSRKIRLGANFYQANELGVHIKGFERLARWSGFAKHPDVAARIRFLKSAKRYGRDVFEIPNVFGTVGAERSASSEVDEEEFRRALGVGEDVPSESSGLNVYEAAVRQVEQALENHAKGKPAYVNFSGVPNRVIANVLHEFAYAECDGVEGPIEIGIVYSDGSETRPFPLFCLKKRDERELAKLYARQPIELKVGMVSFRHPEMDSFVSFYWFRNQEVSHSGSRTLAEIDEICYRISKRELELMRHEEQSYRIRFYQTGFEPAVIGFYRALVEELIARGDEAPSLEVVAYHYRGRRGGHREEEYQDYRKGKSWS